MKQVIVGTYELGAESVQLVLQEGTGGFLFTVPEPGSTARIKVGADCKQWWQLVSVLMHEACELALLRHGCRFAQTPDFAYDNGNYLFVASHTDWSEAMGRAAHFLTPALPDLATAWRKWKKKPKRKKK